MPTTRTLAAAGAIVLAAFLWRQGRLRGAGSRIRNLFKRGHFTGLRQDGVYSITPHGRPAPVGGGFALDNYL